MFYYSVASIVFFGNDQYMYCLELISPISYETERDEIPCRAYIIRLGRKKIRIEFTTNIHSKRESHYTVLDKDNYSSVLQIRRCKAKCLEKGVVREDEFEPFDHAFEVLCSKIPVKGIEFGQDAYCYVEGNDRIHQMWKAF